MTRPAFIEAIRALKTTEGIAFTPRKLLRHAQFMLDFVEAENSTGFHAPEEAERILAESIDYARQGQLALRGVKVPGLRTPETAKPTAAPPPSKNSSRRKGS